jgi:hypothetical protein
LACLLVSALALPTNVFAFKQQYHHEITKRALESKDFSPKSAEAAADANWWTDPREPFNAAAHFDGEQLAAGSARLREKIGLILSALVQCKKDDALTETGRALHGQQDFFSHSNIINHPRPFDIYSLQDPPASLVCRPPDLAPGGLTSGYFPSAPQNKCSHGDLNKDDPGRPLHPQAKAAAEDMTRAFIAKLETEIRNSYPGQQGDALLKLLKKEQRDIAFVIDDTGSMSQDIAGVKAAVNRLVDQILAGDESPKFFLFTFKDNVTFRGQTCDPIELKAKVAPLFASGGGDCPEASNQAQLDAIARLRQGGHVFLATDASSRNPELGPLVLVRAQAKNIKLDTILTGNCIFDPVTLAAGANDAGEPESLSENEAGTASATSAPASPIPPGDLTSPSSRRQFAALAALSGGMLFRVQRIEFAQAADILFMRTRPDNADILSVLEASAGGTLSYEVPVDSTLADVSFVLNRLAGGAFDLTVVRPDGREVLPSDLDAVFTTISGVRAISVTAPAFGRWTARVTGPVTFSLKVFGKSPLDIAGVVFLKPAIPEPRPDAEFLPLGGEPVIGKEHLMEVRMAPGFTEVDFDLRTPSAGPLQDLTLDPVRPLVYGASLSFPAEALLYATGSDGAGHPFQRVFSRPIRAQAVEVVAREPIRTVPPGASVTHDFDVRNHTGVQTVFRLFPGSSHGFPVSAPSSVLVPTGGSQAVTVTVQVPTDAPRGETDIVSLVATSTSDPGVTNSDEVNATIFENQPPNCAAASPSVGVLWPPNHGMVDVSVGGVTDPDGDVVTLTIDAITQDEAVDAPGSGNTCPDGAGLGSSSAQVRAERSGQGDGRIYHLEFTASDGRGGSCRGEVSVCVPHDQRGGRCVDSGPRYDSMVSCH